MPDGMLVKVRRPAAAASESAICPAGRSSVAGDYSCNHAMQTLPQPLLPSLVAARSGVIEYGLLKEVALSAAISAPDVLSRLSRHVAIQYSCGAMCFYDADVIMNAVFSLGASAPYWADHDATIPQAMFEVYCAFDQGEYHHPGDAEDVDPEVKYTRQLIARFLADHPHDG